MGVDNIAEPRVIVRGNNSQETAKAVAADAIAARAIVFLVTNILGLPFVSQLFVFLEPPCKLAAKGGYGESQLFVAFFSVNILTWDV